MGRESNLQILSPTIIRTNGLILISALPCTDSIGTCQEIQLYLYNLYKTFKTVLKTIKK